MCQFYTLKMNFTGVSWNPRREFNVCSTSVLKDLDTMTSTSLHLSPHCPPTARHSCHTAQLHLNVLSTLMLYLSYSLAAECHFFLLSIQRVPYKVRPGSRVSFSLCLLCPRGNCWFLWQYNSIVTVTSDLVCSLLISPTGVEIISCMV